MNTMYGYIYLTLNTINNKKYIGKHKSSVFDENYKGSGILLKRAMDKYGWDNFKTVMILKCKSLDELNKSEIECIEKYNCVESDEFYNLSNGGDGGDTSAWMTKEEKSKKRQGENNPMYNKHHSEKSRQKISEGHMGKKLKPFTEEHKIKLSESNKGKNKGKTAWNKGLKYDEEYKKKLSDSHKGKSGTRNGKHNSEEHKRKISKSRKGKEIKTLNWKKCKIIFQNGDEIIYDNMKKCAKDNNVSYSLVKAIVKSCKQYKDKKGKHPNLKGCIIIKI